MAGTIQERCGKFRARVMRHGVVRSATLPTLDAAHRWVEAIDRNLLTNPPIDVIRKSARPPRVSAVYFLFDHLGALLYVGQTGDLHRRLVRHRELREIPFATYSAIECDTRDERIRLEAYYVRTHLPQRNRIVYRTTGEPPPATRAGRLDAANALANGVRSRPYAAVRVPLLGTTKILP